MLDNSLKPGIKMSPDLIRTLLSIKACAIVASSHSLAKSRINFQE